MHAHDARMGEGVGDATAQGTVLVIEDDAGTAGLIHEALEAEGYRVVRALGAAALARAREARPAVVLLGMHGPGPGATADAIIHALRADVATAGVPIVALAPTAECLRGTCARATSQPVSPDAWLPLPFALDHLCATVACGATVAPHDSGAQGSRPADKK